MYTLQETDKKKRKLIYNNNYKLVSTTPYIIKEIKDIINK